MKGAQVSWYFAVLSIASWLPSVGYTQTVSANEGSNAGSPVASSIGAADDNDPDLQEIVVMARGEGTRDARLSNLQTVDAIGPKDIDSLPSQNIADILKRLPGVQVTYDNGEAQQPNIRGLSFVQTLIDGREAVTAGYRDLQIGDVPADIINGVDVYKSQSANQIEGGIGGIVDIKTKQPFDYKEFHLAGQVSASMDGEQKQALPQGSFALGDSWQTGIGRVGASASIAHTVIDLRSNFFITSYGTSNALFDLNRNGQVGDAADTAVYPTNAFPIEIHSRHTRDSQIGNLQWAPSDELQFTGSLFHSEYLDQSQQYSLLGLPGTTNSAANSESFTTIPGTNVISSGSFANAKVISQSLWVRPEREVMQESLSGTWAHGPVTVSAQADFTQSTNDENIFIYAASATAPTMNYSGATSPNFSSTSFTGLDLSNPATFGSMTYTDILQRKKSDESAGRIDFEYRPESIFLTAIQTGARVTDRNSVSNQALGSNTIAGTLASVSGLASQGLDGLWAIANPNLFENDSAFRERIGLSGALPAASAGNYYSLSEKTQAGYVRALYAFHPFGLLLDGDAGVRVVRSSTDGTAYAVSGTTPIPVDTNGNHTDFLPSGTVRLKFNDEFTLRATASKVMGRPTLDQLSPSVTLSTGTGSAGNPNLKPFYATGGDLGLDWYFSPAGYATFAVFGKSVQGFVSTAVTTETYAGVPYQVSRPVNGGSGSIEGFETNYSQKFVFLPGIFSGLGVDLNFTYLNSSETSVVTHRKQQITGLSKDTLNMSAYYDRGPLLVRIGYAITSKFINQDYLGPTALGGAEIFGRQDVMDATIEYRFTPNLRLTANVLNALQPSVGYYNTTPATPDNSYITYRRYQAGFKFDF